VFFAHARAWRTPINGNAQDSLNCCWQVNSWCEIK
jgi:hypothetical protein